MACGYMGKILFADLTQGRTWEEAPDESTYQDFLGGYGIGARVIFSRQKPKVDPLSPQAILGFVTGPLTGTPALFGCRYMVVAKSPLTGTWGDANSGGDFGPYLKFSGYDAVFFTGSSNQPVYLFIDDGRVELREASHLWGKDTAETEALLQAELGRDTRVACIGPSGERLALISCTINARGRAAGRSGLGAVMGAKKLKAVAVKGCQIIPLAHKSKLEETRGKHMGQFAGQVELFRQFGTCGNMAELVRIGDAPVKNWSGSVIDFPNAGAISDQRVISLQKRKYGCWRCPVACGGMMKAGAGEYKNKGKRHLQPLRTGHYLCWCHHCFRHRVLSERAHCR